MASLTTLCGQSVEQVKKAVSPCISVSALTDLVQTTFVKAKGNAFGIPFVTSLCGILCVL